MDKVRQTDLRAHLGTTTKAGSHANRNAGFIRQAGEWHWGCRMNPAFRRAMTSPERGAGLGRPKTLYRNSVGTLESHPGKAGHPRKRVLRRRPRGRHEA